MSLEDARRFTIKKGRENKDASNYNVTGNLLQKSIFLIFSDILR